MADPLSALKARRDEIARSIAALEAEDQELSAAESVLQRLARNEFGAIAARLPPGKVRRSQREYVLEVLSSCEPAWTRPEDIVIVVKRRWHVALPLTSLRPLLTAMKKAGEITRSGTLVALPNRVSIEARGA